MNIKFASFLLALAMAPAAYASNSDAPMSSQSSVQETARSAGLGIHLHPGRYGRWECASQNARGQRFYGVDRDRRWAQNEAQNRCFRYSRLCRTLGCRTIR